MFLFILEKNWKNGTTTETGNGRRVQSASKSGPGLVGTGANVNGKRATTGRSGTGTTRLESVLSILRFLKNVFAVSSTILRILMSHIRIKNTSDCKLKIHTKCLIRNINILEVIKLFNEFLFLGFGGGFNAGPPRGGFGGPPRGRGGFGGPPMRGGFGGPPRGYGGPPMGGGFRGRGRGRGRPAPTNVGTCLI